MPLLDHFRPPLSRERYWEGFHAAWAGSIADALNRVLPPGYYAEALTHAEASAEIEHDGISVVSTAVWAPKAPLASVPDFFAADYEVRVISGRGGPKLVAAEELVSPLNKDRAATRRTFTTKCAGYLHCGVSLIIIVVVTDRRGDLHHAPIDQFGATAGKLPNDPPLYAAAYRPVRRDERSEVEVWAEPLAVGDRLPTLPLWLDAVTVLPVDAEATYTDARTRRRIA